MLSISVTATSATGTGTGNISSNSNERQKYWCHECDLSVALFSSPLLISPHCHGDFLEEMEIDSPTIHFSPPLDPFPILSPPQESLTFPTDDDTSQIPAAIRVPDDLLSDRHYLDRLIQHLADHDEETFTRYRHSGSTPTSKSSIESIPNVKITNSFLAADTLICAVCKDEFVVDVEAKQLPCKHLYHYDCILSWLSQHNSCPVCRFCLPTDEPEQRSRTRPTRGSRVALRFGNLIEDEDFFGKNSSPLLHLLHISCITHLVFHKKMKRGEEDEWRSNHFRLQRCKTWPESNDGGPLV